MRERITLRNTLCRTSLVQCALPAVLKCMRLQRLSVTSEALLVNKWGPKSHRLVRALREASL